jgi:glycosyltransferase involved in cell wall biosynthesis
MITVIIPSKGRDSLNLALSSLIFQTNPNWTCIVVLDGVEYNNKLDDPRIIYYSINKIGNDVNGAGLVRNKGIEISHTPWVCFLDDDDTFTPDPEMDVCLFKMSYSPERETILPPPGFNQLAIGQVGISFALKRKFIDDHSIRFKNSGVEDYMMLKRCEDNWAKIHYSDYITYNVKHGFI